MDVPEWCSGGDASGPFFKFAYGYFDLINILFGDGGAHNDIFHQIIYSLVELCFHDFIFYYHANSGIYGHIPF